MTDPTGAGVSYYTVGFTVPSADHYRIETTAAVLTPGLNGNDPTDTFLTLYLGLFTPATPLVNAIAADDDGIAGTTFSLIDGILPAGNYTLVVSPWGAGSTGPISGTIAQVPEPAVTALLSTALAGIACARRRQRQA